MAFQDSVWLLTLVPIIAGLTLVVFDRLFRREDWRTFGMIGCAVGLVGLAIGSAFYWNGRGLLNAAWPGLLATAGIWTRDIDSAYTSGGTWKWEAFFGVLFFLAILAFIPFALSLGLQPAEHFRFLLASVITHGTGLLICLYFYLRRFSPRNTAPGLLQLLALSVRVITTAFRAGQVGDKSMAIAIVSNSLTDLLSEMLAGSARTIMYTDIRSSTELVERLGAIDSYLLFTRSWKLSCEVLQRRGATTPKDMGDGLITTFGSSHDALMGAAEILHAHSRYNERALPSERVHLKIGLHRGHVLMHYGWDPRGPDSHLAQRVVSNAGAGMILMTKDTYDDISASGWTIPGRVRQAVTLKGFANPVDLIEVEPETVLASERR